MVRDRCRGQDDQALGSGQRSTKDHLDRTHLGSQRTCSEPKASVSLLLRRRQDGQMLGSRDQQSHSTLPRPLERSLLAFASSDRRCALHRRTRWCSPCLGHAIAQQYSCSRGPQGNNFFDPMSRSRAPSLVWKHGQHNTTLGPGRRKDSYGSHTSQEVGSLSCHTSHRVYICIWIGAIGETMAMPERRFHAELLAGQQHHQHTLCK